MNPYEVYEKYQNEVSSNEELLLRTFEAIFEKLERVKMAIEENIVEAKVEEIGKLVDIFEILRASLDFDNGGEIAKNLDAIYAFCIDELLKTNATNDLEYLANIKEALQPITEGFEEIVK